MAGDFEPVEEIELEDSLFGNSTTSTLKISCQESDPKLPTTEPISDRVTFIRCKGRYTPAKQCKLKNSLLAGVGFLELANCGDFAANVWNQVPIPRYAVALMVVGGTLALAISYFAFKDILLSWRNIRRLREERHYLRTQKVEHDGDGQIIRYIDGQLAVNFREIGTESVDRVSMDILMGFGAVLVGIGTLMAIGGADPKVFQASNLMSGYIGNSPAALYGTVNAIWSIYVWRRARRHGIAGAKELRADILEHHLNPRIRRVQMHAAMNGVTGIVAGAASLVTATMWWGYVILIPCIVSSIYYNYFWRNRIGYERMFVQQILTADKVSLVEELYFVASILQGFEESPSEQLYKLIDPESIASVIEFIVTNSLFEDFCVCLLSDPLLSTALFDTSKAELTLDSRDILTADEQLIPQILKIAHMCVCKMGLRQFQYRERYLLESLGCYLCTIEVGKKSKTTWDGA